MEALVTLVVVLTILFLVWWLNLDRPVRSMSRSMSTLAYAGEIKAANILKDTSEDLTVDELADVKAKLAALKALDL